MTVPIINGKRVAIAEMNAAMMLDILKGDECYNCGEAKRPMNSHCYRCYKTLPPRMQRELYQRFGDGYEDSYRTSLEFLARAAKVSKADLVFGPIAEPQKF